MSHIGRVAPNGCKNGQRQERRVRQELGHTENERAIRRKKRKTRSSGRREGKGKEQKGFGPPPSSVDKGERKFNIAVKGKAARGEMGVQWQGHGGSEASPFPFILRGGASVRRKRGREQKRVFLTSVGRTFPFPLPLFPSPVEDRGAELMSLIESIRDVAYLSPSSPADRPTDRVACFSFAVLECS